MNDFIIFDDTYRKERGYSFFSRNKNNRLQAKVMVKLPGHS
jgi:hypothetical protein